MKVAFIVSAYDPQRGGAARKVRALARGVLRAGGEVEVLCNGSAQSWDATAEDDFPVRRFRAEQDRFGYAASYALWSHLRRHGSSYDVVHVHGYAALPAAVATRRLFRRLAFSPHLHSSISSAPMRWMPRGPYRRQIERAVMPCADLVVCATHAEASDVQRSIGSDVTNAPSVKVVAHGVDVEGIRAGRPYSSTRRLILSLGTPSTDRRLAGAVAALPDLGDAYELVVADIAGSRLAHEAIAADMQVLDQVRLLRRVGYHELYRWLKTASVVLALTDRSDGGQTIAEAAVAGTPVVASDTPAHREVAAAINDPAVRLVPLRSSPLAIADEIAQAAEMRFGPLAALSVPSLTEVSDQTVALYAALLDGRLQEQGVAVGGPALRLVADNMTGAERIEDPR